MEINAFCFLNILQRLTTNSVYGKVKYLFIYFLKYVTVFVNVWDSA